MIPFDEIQKLYLTSTDVEKLKRVLFEQCKERDVLNSRLISERKIGEDKKYYRVQCTKEEFDKFRKLEYESREIKELFKDLIKIENNSKTKYILSNPSKASEEKTETGKQTKNQVLAFIEQEGQLKKVNNEYWLVNKLSHYLQWLNDNGEYADTNTAEYFVEHLKDKDGKAFTLQQVRTAKYRFEKEKLQNHKNRS